MRRHLNGVKKAKISSGVLICRGVPPWAPLLECQIGKGAPTEGRPYKFSFCLIIDLFSWGTDVIFYRPRRQLREEFLRRKSSLR